MYNRFPHRPPALAVGKFSRKNAKSQKVEQSLGAFYSTLVFNFQGPAAGRR